MNPTETRPSLLVRVRDTGDHVAWSQFVDLYAPLIHGYGRKHGLQDADAADLVQEVLQAAAKNLAKFEYDTQKGTFRSWLYRVTRNKFLNWVERKKQLANGSGDTRVCEMLKQHPAEDERNWETQHKWQLVNWAACRVEHEFQKNTWLAFYQTTLEQQPAAQVAKTLGMSVGAVYIAKSRVLTKIRVVIAEVEGED